ncbi:MAG: carbon-nitrogen hydrolase family protein [Cyclobacteriaceae bacterium]
MHPPLRAGLVQMAPIWLNKESTISKMLSFIDEAAGDGCKITAFSEALLPGYPFWIEHTDGAKFESDLQKEYFRIYYANAVDINAGDLDVFREKAREHSMGLYLGCIEKPADRGRSLYCSLVYISDRGLIESVHRKLVPTYEERLVWSPGDGHGLKVHDLHGFRVGGLNCWENWMPGARMALYGQGEDVHLSVWPGNEHNVEQIVPFIGKELRGYAIGVCGLFRKEDIPDELPESQRIKDASIANAKGGTCCAGPDGQWLLPPQTGTEGLFTVELSLENIIRERHNFDPAGHYSRPDVLKLHVDRGRQSSLSDDSFST